jgi:subtilisin family serine protease
MQKNILFLLILAFCPILVYSQNYYSNKLVVKFKKHSNLANYWLSNNRNITFSNFEKILGKNQAKPYIPNELLILYNKSKNSKRYKSSFNKKELNLDLIAIVEYEKSISPELAARKITLLPEIEYAEPLYKHELLIEPNDSLYSEQYYIKQIKANLAWEYVDSNFTVIIGVVDTGVDFEHEDLKDNIYTNSGEIGTDQQGKDKRSNGIDDDGNGFVDDWIGWDFYGDGDNIPLPGNPHGTHVAGIIGAITNNKVGIAGVAKNIKILPVKIGPDLPFATNISNGYQGILYAAAMGADIINCSWGSTHYSQAEADIVEAANQLGSLIVAAAGNNNLYVFFYPAAYNGVLSVAAVNNNDERAYFTNYNYKIDVSAPGVDIMSTIPGNEYRKMSGTSMASPVVAGVAALAKNRFKEKPNFIIREIVKATSDYLYDKNPAYLGQLGQGRVNALRVMTDERLISLRVEALHLPKNVHSNEFYPNDTIKFSLILRNYLDSAYNVSVKIYTLDNNLIKTLNDSVYVGNLANNEIIETPVPFEFVVRDAQVYDKEIKLVARIIADGFFADNFSYDVIISPSYKTFDHNNAVATFNSIGNIGFNDYPNNRQGRGIYYKNGANMAFEGALMLSANGNELYNVARGEFQLRKDIGFEMISAINKLLPGKFATAEGYNNFKTVNDDTLNISNIEIKQNIYQFNNNQFANTIFVIYTIYNKSGNALDSVFLGHYFDWDIGIPQDNLIWWDTNNSIAFAKSSNDTLPLAAVVNLSKYGNNFFAIDNDGASDDNPGVYDGFTRMEKLRFLQNGIQRVQSSVTDASMVLSAGPFVIAENDSVIVSFAIILGNRSEEILREANLAKAFIEELLLAGIIDKYNDEFNIKIMPNPVIDKLSLIINTQKFDYFIIEIYDILGNRIKILGDKVALHSAQVNLSFSLRDLPTGTYNLRVINSKNITKSIMFVKIN